MGKYNSGTILVAANVSVSGKSLIFMRNFAQLIIPFLRGFSITVRKRGHDFHARNIGVAGEKPPVSAKHHTAFVMPRSRKSCHMASGYRTEFIAITQCLYPVGLYPDRIAMVAREIPVVACESRLAEFRGKHDCFRPCIHHGGESVYVVVMSVGQKYRPHLKPALAQICMQRGKVSRIDHHGTGAAADDIGV